MDSIFGAEFIGHLPYECATVDLQHGVFGMDIAINMIQAIASTDAVPLVRVRGNDPGEIGKVLDMGALGVICPMINNAEECAQFVQAARYPPLGTRSTGPVRAKLLHGADYAEKANEHILAFAMVESQDGYNNLDEILEVPGLDGIFIGPSDLSVSMTGTKTNPFHPTVMDAIDDILDRTKAKGLKRGIFSQSIPMSRRMVEKDVELLTLSDDSMLLEMATKQLLKELYE